MSVNDIPYDKECLKNDLNYLADELVITKENEIVFNFFADSIMNGFDYVITRLAEEQEVRFNEMVHY